MESRIAAEVDLRRGTRGSCLLEVILSLSVQPPTSVDVSPGCVFAGCSFLAAERSDAKMICKGSKRACGVFFLVSSFLQLLMSAASPASNGFRRISCRIEGNRYLKYFTSIMSLDPNPEQQGANSGFLSM